MLVTYKIEHIVLATLVITLLGIASATSASQTRIELLKAANTKTSGEYVRNRFLKIMKRPFDSEGKKKALIIGDSHAQDFLNSVVENDYLNDYQISTRYIPTRCQIYLGGNSARLIAPKDKTLCSKSDNLTQAKKQIAEADLIILAASWRKWAAKELPQTIKNLHLTPQQKLFVIGRKSFGKVSIKKYLHLQEDELPKLRNKVDAQQNKINEIMSKTLDKSLFVDIHAFVCGVSSASCPVFTRDLKLISFDGGHLTKDGALFIGKILFQDSLLKNL